jgi:hypothetical protein
MITIGDFGPWTDYQEDATAIDGAIFMISAVVMTMFMFNLLIAIFTDTYGEIKDNERAIELKLMNDVILEIEQIHSFITYRNSCEHLVYVEYQKKPFKNWQGNVKAAAKLIKDDTKAFKRRVDSKVEDLTRKVHDRLESQRRHNVMERLNNQLMLKMINEK